jgi:deoxyadenosine/deoxycytidine kinase
MGDYIVFEGCLGAGKTTMAKFTAKHLTLHPLLENVTIHPFMTEFHNFNGAYALETELLFPIIHFHQLAQAHQRGLFNNSVVSDFSMEKDLIFCKANLLSKRDTQTFVSLWDSLRSRVPNPNLVIYLEASTHFLLSRIRARRRAFERLITFDYLDRLNKAYGVFMKSYVRSPVIKVDAESVCRLNSMETLEVIRGALKQGSVIGRAPSRV